ncbi:sigma-54-dependent Fis family transcriptional regulator [Spirosoma arcticum]
MEQIDQVLERPTLLAPDETSLLLTISQTIAAVRERKELFTAIFEHLKPVIPVDDTGILVLDKTGKYWQDWTNVDNYQGHQAATQLQQKGYDQFLPMDRFTEYTLNHTGVITVAQFRGHYPEHPFGEVMWEAGIRELMFTPLMHRGKKLGVLFLDSEQEGTYTEAHLRLCKTIADLIAVAVANILANEEILEREREKTQLLKITELIAQVKATNDLLWLIVDKIKPLFGFHDCGLFVVSADEKTHTDLAAVLPDVSPSEWNEAIAAVSANIPHTGSAAEWMMQELATAGEPVLFDFQELVERFPDYPQISGTGLLEMGYRDCLAAGLTVRGKSIGFFCINALQKEYFQPAVFTLFQTVTHTISIAIANILTNEEVQRLNEQLQEQNAYLIEEVEQQYNLGEMVGQSPALQNLHHNLRLVAPTDTTVLIMGESGTGKELVVRALHQASSRRAKALIKINCAALPANLIESELFGHERGAFTGATDRRVGKFELAHGSTLFLDEIGELPLDLQAKLLRAIQEKEIERLGGNKVIPTDVRIISATNRNLAAEVQAGRFRADLYYRLSVFPLTLPPLRERPDDLLLLVTHFVQKMARRLGKPLQGVSGRAMRQVLAYDWPGNIRELENVLERAAILSPGKVIQELYLPTTKPGPSATAGPVTALIAEDPTLKTAADNERDHILRVLRHCKGKVSGRGGAAELLQLKASTLEFRMKKLGIRREHLRGDQLSGIVD